MSRYKSRPLQLPGPKFRSETINDRHSETRLVETRLVERQRTKGIDTLPSIVMTTEVSQLILIYSGTFIYRLEPCTPRTMNLNSLRQRRTRRVKHK